MSLPAPSADALRHSLNLEALICREIADSGPISFARYMQRALYEPDHGYYMSSKNKFGAFGDFVTAPEISTLYPQCIAAQCAQILKELPGSEILEFGAGSGLMAIEIMRRLQKLDCLPDCYYILEVSGGLRQRQQDVIRRRAPEYIDRIRWLDSLEGVSINGIILANEVLDAMPVDRFCIKNSSIVGLGVGWDDSNQCFNWAEYNASVGLVRAVEDIIARLPDGFVNGYSSEVNINLFPWFKTVARCLHQGLLLLIDYGYARRDYYLPERDAGTLMCYYQHRVHDDPFFCVGLQDISAHIDFTAVAEVGKFEGFELAGYTDQTNFLINCGMEKLVNEHVFSSDVQTRLDLSQQVKTLLFPGQMGDRFKVMGMTKRYNRPLTGFNGADDQRHRL